MRCSIGRRVETSSSLLVWGFVASAPFLGLDLHNFGLQGLKFMCEECEAGGELARNMRDESLKSQTLTWT